MRRGSEILGSRLSPEICRLSPTSGRGRLYEIMTKGKVLYAIRGGLTLSAQAGHDAKNASRAAPCRDRPIGAAQPPRARSVSVYRGYPKISRTGVPPSTIWIGRP